MGKQHDSSPDVDEDDGDRSVPKLRRASELDAATLLRLADLSKLDNTPAELAPSAEGIALFDPVGRSNGNGPVKSALMAVADHVSGLVEPNGTGKAGNINNDGSPDDDRQESPAAGSEASATPPSPRSDPPD